MNNDFQPRTYGSTLWWVFTGLHRPALNWGTGFTGAVPQAGHQALRSGFITVADAQAVTLGIENMPRMIEENEDRAREAINAVWPANHAFPRWAMTDVLNAAKALNSAPFSLDLDYEPMLYGWPELMAFTDASKALWAWARDPYTNMPRLGDNPVDTLMSHLSETLGITLDGTAAVKAFVALIGEEKARTMRDRFPEGARASITERHPSGALLEVGDVVEVVNVNDDDLNVAKVLPDGSLDRQTWFVARRTPPFAPVPDAAPVEEPAPVEDPAEVGARALVETLRAEVAALKAEHDHKDTLIVNFRRWQGQANADAEVIGEVLTEEANRRNWCSEYDEIVNRINGRLNVLTLPDREREVEVVVSGYLRVPFSRTVTITTRGDDDDAIERAEEEVAEESGYDLLSYIDRGEAEIDGDLESEVQ